MISDIINKAKSLGIETNITKRWETGISHHAKSKELMAAFEEIDFYLCGDYFCWKTGGEGDNGEALMYEMDIFFETQDKLNLINKLTKSSISI